VPTKTIAKRAAKKASPPQVKAPAKRIAGPTKSSTSPTAKATPARKTADVPTPGPQVAKAKLIRDSFTMPQSDFALIAGMKERALSFKRPAKKSELLRAGLHVLTALNDTALRAALDALAPLKPGRPKKAA
jgi:hypothetical protein